MPAGNTVHASQQKPINHKRSLHGSIEVVSYDPISDSNSNIFEVIDHFSTFESTNHPFEVAVLEFSASGGEILIVGTHGEIACLDSLSSARIWSIPAHLEQLKRAHIVTSSQSSLIPEFLLVDEYGLVRS